MLNQAFCLFYQYRTTQMKRQGFLHLKCDLALRLLHRPVRIRARG